MKVNVTQVRQMIGDRQSFSFNCPLQEIAGDETGLWLYGRIEVDGELVNNGRFLEINGVIKATAAQNCNRCLVDFTRAVAVPFSENIQEGAETGDPEIWAFQGDEVDISEIVREALVLAEPLKALCSEECKGLCPQCGTNQNVGSCSCDRTSIDPRLATLKKLLEPK